MRDWPGVVHLDLSVSPFDRYEPDPATRSTLDFVTDAATYLPTLRQRLSGLRPRHRRRHLQRGCRSDQYCQIGGLRGITEAILAEREQMVFDWAQTRRVPVAFVLAGGYVGGRLSQEGLVGLHRLTIAAAALSNAGETLTTDSIRDLAASSSVKIAASVRHH